MLLIKYQNRSDFHFSTRRLSENIYTGNACPEINIAFLAAAREDIEEASTASETLVLYDGMSDISKVNQCSRKLFTKNGQQLGEIPPTLDGLIKLVLYELEMFKQMTILDLGISFFLLPTSSSATSINVIIWAGFPMNLYPIEGGEPVPAINSGVVELQLLSTFGQFAVLRTVAS